MNITKNIDSPLPPGNMVNDIKNQQVNSYKNTSPLPTVNSPIDDVSISPQGISHQKIDLLFNQADVIYQSNISPKQQKLLDESYDKLDELFSQSAPSQLEQKNANALFDKIDKIFEQAEKQLTPSQKEQLLEINTKLDGLLGTEELQLEDDFSEKIDKLFQESESLLTSKLSNEQAKSLNDLNKQLNVLFEKNNIDNEAVTGIFDKIDSIINQGYDKLSIGEKNKLDNYNAEIDEIFSQLEQEDTEINYP